MQDQFIPVLLLVTAASLSYWFISTLKLPVRTIKIAQYMVAFIWLMVLIGTVFGGVPLLFRTRQGG